MLQGFFGEFECKLDDKNRLVLPSRLKSEITTKDSEEDVVLVLSKGFEPCINIYTPAAWESSVLDKVRRLDPYRPEHRALQRAFLGGSTEISMDKTGRILLPKLMQAYASLNRDLLLVGVDDRIEIWNPDKYQENMLSREVFSQMAAQYLASPPPMPVPKVFNISLQDSEAKAVH